MRRAISTFYVLPFVFAIMLFSLVAAQEQTADTAVDAGVNPDSPLWGLDRAIERIELALAFGASAKSEKGLEHAAERLAEVKAMIEENKIEKAEKAEIEHGRTIIIVKENIKEITTEGSIDEIKKTIELENKLKSHEDEIEGVEAELKIKIKIEGTLTEEQQAKLDEFLNSLEGDVREVKIEIKNKKTEIKIKIMQQTGKTEDEVDEEIEELESEIKVKAEIIGDKTEIKVEQEFETETTDKEALISEIIDRFSLDRETAGSLLKIEEEEEEELEEEKLKVKIEIEEGISEVKIKLKFILNATDRGAILDAIVERTKITREQIEEVLKLKIKEDEEEEEEIEIEVEIKDTVAKVELEFGDAEQEFVLQTTDQEVILKEIASRLGVSVDSIRPFVKFEIDKNGDDDEDEIEDDEFEDEEDDDENGSGNGNGSSGGSGSGSSGSGSGSSGSGSGSSGSGSSGSGSGGSSGSGSGGSG